MKESDFLRDYANERLRERLWLLFQEAENHAKKFVESDGDWVEIRSVDVGKAGWAPDGRIWIEPNQNDLGVILHEVFHSAFHRSTLHDGGADENWGDAWCDAFRSVMEHKQGLANSSSLCKNIERLSGMTCDQAMGHGEDANYNRAYAYPASLIIKQVGCDLDALCRLWFKLTATHSTKRASVLNEFFGYHLALGVPI